MKVDLTTVQELLREALQIWDQHGQALTDDTLPIFLVAHLAGNDHYIIHRRLQESGNS